MKQSSADLAQSITRTSSLQSYTIARLLVDRDLVNDCLRAYAYFRWADDVIDIVAQSREERLTFIEGQKMLLERLYGKERPDGLRSEEAMIADLVEHDRGEYSGLQSFIRNFMAVLVFDAGRKGRLISEAELTWYSSCLGKAVTDAIQYFIGNDQVYPQVKNQYLAATAAHITHMLRDMVEDLSEGFINIPCAWLAKNGFNKEAQVVGPDIINNALFRAWVRDQVDLARAYFHDGKGYLDQLTVLRCKIAGYWYCARFECVLDAIERDAYVLRPEYHEHRKLSSKIRMGWLAVSLTIRHLAGRKRSRSRLAPHYSGTKLTATEQ